MWFLAVGKFVFNLGAECFWTMNSSVISLHMLIKNLQLIVCSIQIILNNMEIRLTDSLNSRQVPSVNKIAQIFRVIFVIIHVTLSFNYQNLLMFTIKLARCVSCIVKIQFSVCENKLQLPHFYQKHRLWVLVITDEKCLCIFTRIGNIWNAQALDLGRTCYLIKWRIFDRWKRYDTYFLTVLPLFNGCKICINMLIRLRSQVRC